MWHYGIVKCAVRGGEPTFTIHEIYEDIYNKGTSFTEFPSEPFGMSLQELKEDLEMMIMDFHTYPVYENIDGRIYKIADNWKKYNDRHDVEGL